MRITVETVTPEIAAQMLSANTINRSLRHAHVAILAKQIMEGKWRTTSQGIAIAEDGTLLDGQHRLSAIIQANTAVEIAVARNCPKEIFPLIDQTMIVRKMSDSTGISRRDMEIVSGLYGLSPGNNRLKIDVDRANEIYAVFGDAIRYLHQEVGGHTKHFSSKPVRTAAVLHMQANPENIGYVIEGYRNLCSAIQSMPPIQWAFWKSITHGTNSREILGITKERDMMMRAWIAFSPENALKSRIQINKECKAWDEMRAAFSKAMGD